MLDVVAGGAAVDVTETPVLRNRAVVGAAELVGHIVDGVRPGVGKEEAETAGETALNG